MTKMFLHALIIFMITLAVMLGSVPQVQGSSSWEIDKTSVVNWVTDGDTFNVTSGDVIRLADIDAPESYESGYAAAKDYLFDMICNKTIYLDIDDISRNDTWGRLICVAFVDYNSTHVINVNKALLVAGYANVTDFTNNEFDPDTWTLYVPKMAIPEVTNVVVLAAVLSLVSITLILLKKKSAK